MKESDIKRYARVIGIDDGPFDKFSDEATLVIGTISRGGFQVDGVVSTEVAIDGDDSTCKLIDMITHCRFFKQIQCILLDGIALGGFNVVDVNLLHEGTGIPVIVVMRFLPDLEKVKEALEKIGKSHCIPLIDKAGTIEEARGIYIQRIGIERRQANQILKHTMTNSHIPEPIRLSHLYAAGIMRGESKGNV